MHKAIVAICILVAAWLVWTMPVQPAPFTSPIPTLAAVTRRPAPTPFVSPLARPTRRLP